VTPDRQFWRCTATLPDGTRCPYPGRIGIGSAPKLCRRHAFPEGQAATEPAHDGIPPDGADD
jgi:hypothetical protein